MGEVVSAVAVVFGIIGKEKKKAKIIKGKFLLYNHRDFVFKELLVPLAGVALLGAAAAFVSNPILLQLGVISGVPIGEFFSIYVLLILLRIILPLSLVQLTP